MPVPKLHKYQHKVDVNKLKLDGVEDKLLSMGYACNNCKEMIAVIELEVSDNFEMSDEEYKQFQKRIKEGQTLMMTNEEREQLRKDVEEGRTWITY